MQFSAITLVVGLFATQIIATPLLEKRISCNNGKGTCFVKTGACISNDGSGAGAFPGNFAECATPGAKAATLPSGNDDATVNAGASCNNGKGVCAAATGACISTDGLGSGAFPGNFAECFS